MTLGSRRQAREIALQILYQLDGEEQLSDQQAVALFWKNLAAELDEQEGAPTQLDATHREFAERLVLGARKHLAEVDGLIGQASRNWRIERMARVDRNLLRLAVYELKYAADVPHKAAINEAIEIAKRFGTAESPAFINGILDKCLDHIAGPDRARSRPGSDGDAK